MLIPTIAHAGTTTVIGSWRPGVALSIAVLAAVYQRGARGGPDGARLFFAGLVTLAIALATPLDALAGSLASAHMVQHLLILLVAAPLVAASEPIPTLLRAIPLPAQRTMWRGLRRVGLARPGARLVSPAAVWLGYTGTLWVWHAAVPYQAAVRSEWIHALEHATFLLVGWGFWHFALGRGRLPMLPGFRVLFMFTAAMQGVLLAALLTFASTPWYPAYAESTVAFGLDPLTDQHLAGVLMWVPSGLVYTAVSLAVLVRWIGHGEQAPGRISSPARERPGGW